MRIGEPSSLSVKKLLNFPDFVIFENYRGVSTSSLLNTFFPPFIPLLHFKPTYCLISDRVYGIL